MQTVRQLPTKLKGSWIEDQLRLSVAVPKLILFLSFSLLTSSIEVVESRRPSKIYEQRFEHGNLICIKRENNSTHISPSTEFAVPKCLFTNICGLAKSKNRLRAPFAIEAHLNNQDIDICVVSDTHLSTDLPDSIVNIPEYNLFRRDRGWLGRDKR